LDTSHTVIVDMIPKAVALLGISQHVELGDAGA
jgi:hypothetical protein